MSVFRKHDDGPVSTALEAQGLTWLAEAMVDGGAHVVPVTSGPGWLEEPRLTTTGVTPAGAEAFGRALAVTHAAGAPAFGAAPPGWDGRAQMGRSDIRLQPHAAEEGEPRRWGEFYAEDRILPYLQPSRDNGSISVGGARVIERLCERLDSGDLDHGQPRLVADAIARREDVGAARTHGDLWNGNVMWTPGGAVLIDPAAQGGHAEEDLAALAVFGCPYYERILAAYNEASPLEDGWRERLTLHQAHIIMIHCAVFGRSYVPDAVAIARRYA